MHRILALSLLSLVAATAPAQANDYGGLRISSPSGGSPTPFACGTPFSCTPTSFSAVAGDPVSAAIFGEFNGLFIIGGSFDVAGIVCAPLGLPGIANSLILPPGSILTVAIGLCSQSDNGRCNGGFAFLPLFTIPPGFTGSLVFQGVISSPLSAGGSGFAFSNAVVMNF